MAAMFATERYLWLILLGIKKKEKSFLIDSLVSPSSHFGTAADIVFERFREARVQSAVFKCYIPFQAQAPSAPATPSDQGPSTSAFLRAPPRTLTPWRGGQVQPHSSYLRRGMANLVEHYPAPSSRGKLVSLVSSAPGSVFKGI